MARERLIHMVPSEERELTALELVDLMEQIMPYEEKLYRMFLMNGKTIVVLNSNLDTIATIDPVGDPTIKWANGRVARLEKP